MVALQIDRDLANLLGTIETEAKKQQKQNLNKIKDMTQHIY